MSGCGTFAKNNPTRPSDLQACSSALPSAGGSPTAPALRSAACRASYEPPLALPVTRRCATPYDRCAPRPLTQAYGLRYAPALVASAPRTGASLRPTARTRRVAADGSVGGLRRAVADNAALVTALTSSGSGSRYVVGSPRPAAVRGPTFPPLLGRCDACAGLRTTRPHGRPAFPCIRRTWNPGNRAAARRAWPPPWRSVAQGADVAAPDSTPRVEDERSEDDRSPEERSERRATHNRGRPEASANARTCPDAKRSVAAGRGEPITNHGGAGSRRGGTRLNAARRGRAQRGRPVARGAERT